MLKVISAKLVCDFCNRQETPGLFMAAALSDACICGHCIESLAAGLARKQDKAADADRRAYALKAYLNGLPDDDARRAFAALCETSVGHLRNVMYGIKPCSAELAVLIEEHSGRQVTRQNLLPTKWRRIWPELARAEAGQGA